MIKDNFKHTIRACYLGYINLAVVNNFIPLLFLIFQRSFDIPLKNITLLVMLNFLVQLLTDYLSAKFVDKIGYRISMVTAHLLVALGLFGLAVLPNICANPYPAIVASVVIYAVGGGLIEVLISPILEACPSENKAKAMSLLHSFYCWGCVLVILVSTLLLKLLGEKSWSVIALIWMLLPLFNALYFSRVPIATLTAKGEGMTVKELLKTKLFWLFVILIFLSGAAEQAMNQWASSFAESGLKVSKSVGDLAGPGMFAVLMGFSRLFYGKFGDKVDLSAFMTGSGILCVISYLTVALSNNPVISLIGCAVCGLSVGILWPGVFSLSAAQFKRGGTAMFAILALAGDAGCSAGPTFVGLVASGFNDKLKLGISAGMIFPIFLVILCFVYRAVKRNKSNCQG